MITMMITKKNEYNGFISPILLIKMGWMMRYEGGVAACKSCPGG